MLERPRWDDPVWSTNVPTPFLITRETLAMFPHPPPHRGGGGSLRSSETKGASALAPHNTS
ncbi:hypothetical protein [Hyphomonas sp.]|uniref:hypothetical protein n=1 Tax=Hyphomonas sp. TaxID=87 RepID=UPI003919033C